MKGRPLVGYVNSIESYPNKRRHKPICFDVLSKIRIAYAVHESKFLWHMDNCVW